MCVCLCEKQYGKCTTNALYIYIYIWGGGWKGIWELHENATCYIAQILEQHLTKQQQYNEQDTQDTTGEAGMSSWVTFPYGPPRMNMPGLVDQ